MGVCWPPLGTVRVSLCGTVVFMRAAMLGALCWFSSGVASLELDVVLLVPLKWTFGHDPRYFDASGGLVRGGTGGGRSGGRWNPLLV